MVRLFGRDFRCPDSNGSVCGRKNPSPFFADSEILIMVIFRAVVPSSGTAVGDLMMAAVKMIGTAVRRMEYIDIAVRSQKTAVPLRDVLLVTRNRLVLLSICIFLGLSLGFLSAAVIRPAFSSFNSYDKVRNSPILVIRQQIMSAG